ncbi:shikimate kinase [Exilibacterium tricleocarpae]|uniref:Shikimate kinase n=1 Tax=Exilibacterium tricleocarpae TaxID=2591008 RepID=A0A545U574_9GAMM|nr:shikimate kinase [Exilibacterium tricleocarpae]TQV84620.1 shikimate kinase [Exilibacterium tricleocarpae]
MAAKGAEKTAGSVVLIGMPGAGKSTIGVMLAKELAKDFVDTDVLIQVREGRTLQSIMDGADYLHLRQIEEAALLDAHLPAHVVATGGSAVYSDAGMQHLKQYGVAVFLDLPLADLQRRIHNYAERGIARRPGQTFEALFAERRTLYLQHADIVVDCHDKTPERIIGEIIRALARF